MEPVTPRSIEQPAFRPDSDQWTNWGWPARPTVLCLGCYTTVQLYSTGPATHDHPERGTVCTGEAA